jgi:transcriptional regulator with XRE-family HTH domain
MNKNEEIGKRIRIVRRMLGITRQDLSEKYNIEYKSFSLWETGKVNLTEKIIHQCIQIFLKEGIDCSFEWFQSQKGEEPKFINKEITTKEYFLKKPNMVPEIRFFLDVENYRTTNTDSILHQVKNRAMAPLVDVGDVVGGEPLHTDDYYQAHGRMSIISLEENKFMVRHVFKRSNQYIFTAENTLAAVVNPLVVKESPLIIAPINFYRKSPINNYKSSLDEKI